MASPTQLVQFTFAGGIDQSIRSEAVDPTAAFVNVENVRAPSRGEADKRDGFDAFTGVSRVDATVRTAGYRQFAHGKQTCTIDGALIDSYSPEEAILMNRGRVPECGLSFMKVPSPPGQSSIAVTDSIRVGAFYIITGASASQATVYACVVEATTGQVILPYTAVVTGVAGEIFGLLGARGTTAMLFVAEGSNADIMYAELDCADASTVLSGWSSATAAVGDSNGLLAFNVASSGSYCWMAYVNDSAGASQVSVELYDGGAGGSTTIDTNSATPGAIGLDGTSGTLWVAWNETTSVRVKGLSGTNLAVTNATTATVITTATAPDDIGSIHVVTSSPVTSGRLFVNDGTDGALHARYFVTTLGAVATAGAQMTAYGVLMAGAPFRVSASARYYGPCRGYESTGDVVLCDLTEEDAWVRPVANLPARLSYSLACARSGAHSATERWFPFTIQTTGRAYSGSVAKFDFAADARWRAVPHNGATFLSGGLVSFFDGLRVAESGFVIQPPAVSLSTNGAGAFSSTGGGINVVITYEHADAAGNVHMSGVSEPTNIAAFTNVVNLAIVVRNLGISGRIEAATDPNMRICIWVTADGGEPPYYLLTTLTNTLTSETQTYNMTGHVLGSEALLMGTGNLPNTGAQLDRRAPQGLPHLCAYNGFLVGAGGEEVFWTGQDIDGEGAWWNDSFSAAVTGGGDVTALETQDGVLYVFKRDRIFAMAGIPPLDNGADGGLGAPQRLAVNVGASSPFTCVTEMGIFFVSERGIELLNRSRGVEYIGEQVQTTFASYPYVSAMTYDPVSSCVLIEASSGRSAGLPTGGGRTFVYDIKARVWRSFDRRSVSASTDVPAADGCMVWNGSAWRYGWLRSTGATYVETSEHHLDPGDVWVTKKAKTGYVKLSGIQGQQFMNRVLLLAKKSSTAGLSIAAGYDYDASFETATDWTAAALDTLSTSLGRIQVGHDLHDDAEGQAVAVEITDSAPASVGTGQGATWIALTFEGQPRPNAVQLSSEAR
jgi:hypothetical protein